ncbi:MAG: hypothetical protein WDN49_02470, partial [Acetobacteraceae bacterium]
VTPVGPATAALSVDLTSWVRPLCLGLSVGHPRGSTGSIGPFVRLADGRTAFLSSSIVLAPKGATRGDMIHQPGPRDQSVLTGQTRVGALWEFTPLVTGPARNIDFGAAVLLDGIETSGNHIPPGCPEAGRPITTVVDSWALETGDAVAFAGLGSAYGEAQVVATDFTISVAEGAETLTFTGAIELQARSGPCSRPGDAGALVWRRSDAAAIGMILASVNGSDDFFATYVLPLGPALAVLGGTLLAPSSSL